MVEREIYVNSRKRDRFSCRLHKDIYVDGRKRDCRNRDVWGSSKKHRCSHYKNTYVMYVYGRKIYILTSRLQK